MPLDQMSNMRISARPNPNDFLVPLGSAEKDPSILKNIGTIHEEGTMDFDNHTLSSIEHNSRNEQRDVFTPEKRLNKKHKSNMI